MELLEIAAGLVIDPDKEPITEEYPGIHEVSQVYQQVYRYDALDALLKAKNLKEFCELCPDVKHLKISKEIFAYLKASTYISGAPGGLICAIEKILKETNCGNMVPYRLSKTYIDRLTTFGYLKDGLTLNAVILAMLGNIWSPVAKVGGYCFRKGGVEYCISEGNYVFVPTELYRRFLISNWRVINNTLYFNEDTPYGYKK